ncbi:hypothetical protein C8Q74DRAFT_338795 [Fomes fomentarius]|nr:hypothetical protein C8Q74DRAFT_338795 [Fomes fomentarius]
MSSSDYADIISYVASILPYELCLFSGTAILLYDTLITLDVEVEVVWTRKLSILGLLHVFNRYTAIVAFIEALILLFPVSDSMPRIFSAFRMFALTNRNIPLTTLVFLLNASYLLPDLYNDAHTRYVNDAPPYGCYQSGARDNTIVSCTLGITGRLAPWRCKCRPRTIVWILCKNGIACFIFPLVMNAVTLALNVVTEGAASMGQCIIVFRDAITTILISRFLLDLGTLSARSNSEFDSLGTAPDTLTSHFSSTSFETFVSPDVANNISWSA